jgi:D-alanyl-D-alanine carboxypeptidase/D-alanyl-D-alanine-endopeptidase (penicillin-binding protein 4)
LSFSDKFADKIQLLINGKTADLPKRVSGQSRITADFNESKLRAFQLKPAATPTPMQTPVPAVTPTPTPTPTQTPVPMQTVGELQNFIRQNLARPNLQRGQVGIKIVSLDTGKTIFEENAEKYFMPASNMKSYTVAAALERLSPGFRFVTSVYGNSRPDANGVLKGDLRIYGRGDVSFAFSFARPEANAATVMTNADYLKLLEPLADKIIQSGVKRVEGDLIGDDSYFNSSALPVGWEWDDLQAYYGAEVSALNILDNAVDVAVMPGSLNGPCAVQILPVNTLFTIVNRCTTTSSEVKKDLQIVKKIDRNVLEIYGTVPVGDRGTKSVVSVSRPAQLFVEMLRQVLQQKGVVITGQNKVFGFRDLQFPVSFSTTPPVELTRHESLPFSIVAARTMKPSQNMYTEVILRALGEQVGDKTDPKTTSDRRGTEVVKSFLTQIGAAPDSVMQYDGSGLSRHNLITPASNVQLYSYMAKSPNAQAWRDSLTIGGVDGTLRNRFAGTAAANNVRGKTGTINQVSGLTGT